MPVMTQRILTGPAHVEWLWVNDFSHNKYHIWHVWPSTCWHVWSKLPKYEVPVFAAQTPNHWRKWKGYASVPKNGLPHWCVIEFYVSANNRKVTSNIDHVSCIWVYMPFVSGTELMFNTGSLSNQALKSAHPSLLSSHWWPWGGVFIGAGQLLQHGEVRDTKLAWVRPVAMSQEEYVNILSKHLLILDQHVSSQTQPRCRISQSTTCSTGPHIHWIWTSSKLCGDGYWKNSLHPASTYRQMPLHIHLSFWTGNTKIKIIS